MENDLENNGWKKEAPYLASLERLSPFELPEGYFEFLSERIEAQVFLAELREDMNVSSLKVPAGYFDNLGDRIQASVLVDTLKEKTGVGGLIAPEQYFEKLSSRIAAKTKDKQSTGLIRLLQSNFFKYSAAACVVLMSGILLYVNEPSVVSPKMSYTDAATEQMLFDIDEEVIIEHIQHHETERAAGKISDAELENYILNNFSQNDLTSE